MLFAESDWGGSFCCYGFFVFALISWGIGQGVKSVGNAAKSVVQNETVQEAGKGILAAWLESMFRK